MISVPSRAVTKRKFPMTFRKARRSFLFFLFLERSREKATRKRKGNARRRISTNTGVRQTWIDKLSKRQKQTLGNNPLIEKLKEIVLLVNQKNK